MQWWLNSPNNQRGDQIMSEYLDKIMKSLESENHWAILKSHKASSLQIHREYDEDTICDIRDEIIAALKFTHLLTEEIQKLRDAHHKVHKKRRSKID